MLRTKLQPANDLTETLLAEILRQRREHFDKDKRVAVLVNNLGATTEMELAIVARHAVPFLESKGLVVERIYAGTFLSSLDMAGISISVLGLNDEWLRWLDASTAAPAWPNAAKQRPGKLQRAAELPAADVVADKPLQSKTSTKTVRAIEAACEALIRTEQELTELDRLTGDGDLGTSMERASKAVLAAVDTYPLDDVPATLKAIGDTLRRELGGSSGPLYGVLLLRCGRVLETTGAVTLTQWTDALAEGLLAISELGGAQPGDRTMLDALHPFVKALTAGARSAERVGAVLKDAMQAAERGVEATARMKPRLGRSSYLDRVIGHPDPGAKAVAIWLGAVSEVVGTD